MEKGYDAGKKVSGIKRHIAVDTQGLPHALAVTTADITDRKGCLLALERDKDNLGAVQKVLADGGYTGKAFASSVQELMGAEVEIVKRNELHRFAVLPKRWVVERSFSWLEKNRRLWKNCERKLRRIGQKRSYLGGPCVYRTKKELSIVRHGEIILYKLDFILSFHPVMTPQFAL